MEASLTAQEVPGRTRCNSFLTRTNQSVDKALEERGMTSKDCDLFLSLHSNAVGSYMDELIDYVAVYHLTADTTTECDDISKAVAAVLALARAGAHAIAYYFSSVRIEDNDKSDVPYLIRVANVLEGDVLNIRKEPKADAAETGQVAYNNPNKFTIVAEQNGW